MVLAALVAAASAWGRRTTAAPNPSNSLTITLAVEAFRTTNSDSRSRVSTVFADSLSARLARLPGLTVRPPGGTFGPHTDFTVRGDVAARDGRLVIAARLYRRDGGKDAVWTATFWRSDSLTSGLVSDVAAAIAEATYGQLARDTTTTTGERP